MPILLVLAVAAACSPVPWPDPLDLGVRTSVLATAFATFFSISLSALLSAWVVRSLRRDPDRRTAVQPRYAKLRRRLGLLNLGLAGLVIAGGWGSAVWQLFRIDLGPQGMQLAPGAELLVPAPYFLTLVAGWVANFFAERAVHRARTGGTDGFWTLTEFVLFYARQFTLLILVPILLYVAQQGLVRTVPSVVASSWFEVSTVVIGLAVFLLLPRFVKPLLGLTTLPAGPTRDRLEATARRLKFRTTDLLLWSTRGAIANAMIVGVVPWARYVVFTDRLIDGLTPEELDAVFGHEAGHARHYHIPYYAAFFLLSASVATVGLTLLDHFAGRSIPTELAEWMTLPPLAAMGIYIFLVFGLLSRRCERQADVDGCRAGSCDNPNCQGHDDSTVLAPHGSAVCRTGVQALVCALDRVAQLNGMDGLLPRSKPTVLSRFVAILKAWQHGPVPDRIEFLLRLSDDPALGDRHDCKVRRFRIGLMVGLLLVLAACGVVLEWINL